MSVMRCDEYHGVPLYEPNPQLSSGWWPSVGLSQLGSGAAGARLRSNMVGDGREKGEHLLPEESSAPGARRSRRTCKRFGARGAVERCHPEETPRAIRACG